MPCWNSFSRVITDRRRHNSFSGEIEELTSRLDSTLTRGSIDSPVELRVSAHASPRRQQTNRTLSDSAAMLSSSPDLSSRMPTTSGGDQQNGRPDLTAGLPPVPPPRTRVERKNKHEDNGSPPRLVSNGLPPTPKVHMGACFMKVSLLSILFHQSANVGVSSELNEMPG